MANDTVVKALTSSAEMSVRLKYTAQHAHWNVVGATFGELHKLFQGVYEAADQDTDVWAEFVRFYGAPVALNVSVQPSSGSKPDDLLQKVLGSVEAMIGSLAMLRLAAGDDNALANAVDERDAVYRKFAWMLRSSMSSDASQATTKSPKLMNMIKALK